MTEKITDDGNDRSMIIMMEILVILIIMMTKITEKKHTNIVKITFLGTITW